MCNLGTFSEHVVVHEASLVKVDTGVNLRAAALVSCGLATGLRCRGRPRPGASRRDGHRGRLRRRRLGGHPGRPHRRRERDHRRRRPRRRRSSAPRPIGATHGAAEPPRGDVPRRRAHARQARRRRDPHAGDAHRATSSSRPARRRRRAGGSSRSRSRRTTRPRSRSTCSPSRCTTSRCMGTVFGSQSPRVQIPRILDLYNKGHVPHRRAGHQRVHARQRPAGLRRPRGGQERPRRRQVRLIGDAAEDAGRSRGAARPARRALTAPASTPAP